MSGERPDALDLLRTAREALIEELLPALAPEHRYTARMVANAIDIAVREIERDALGDPAATLETLERLYGPERIAHGADPGRRAEELLALLASDLRAGELDGGCEAGVRALLRRRIVERLRVSNPRYLERAGASDPPDPA